jgi:nucleoside-diphosphate-sugar epimerase
MNVAAVASRLHVPLVYASTGSVYMPIKQKPPITEDFAACGNSVYGCTKYLGELYVRQVTPHIILRYAHLYGAEKRMHGLIGGFLARIERGLAPTLYGGKQSNDFTYIKDVAKANVMALTTTWDKWNQAYNVGTGEELSAESAGKIICSVFNYAGAGRRAGAAHGRPGPLRLRLLEGRADAWVQGGLRLRARPARHECERQ